MLKQTVLGSPKDQSSDACSQRRCAFTLVELLVVIGIIALLISILLPSLNKARQAANTVVCSSNLRQVGIAIQMYASENGGSVPMGSLLLPNYGWAIDWTDQIAKYVGKKFTKDSEWAWVWGTDFPAFRCPEDIVPARSGYGFRKTYALNTCSNKYAAGAPPYAILGMTEVARLDIPGFTATGPFTGTLAPYYTATLTPRYHKLKDARDAAGTILATEVVYEYNVIGWGQNSRQGTIEYMDQQTQNLRAPLHGKKFNYLMCDGHVETLNPFATIGTGTNWAPRGMWTWQTGD